MIPGRAPASEDTRAICDKTWFKILTAGDTCDSWTKLAREWITVQLNVYSGACLPKSVADAAGEARTLLEANCGGITDWTLEGNVERLRLILSLYNGGKLGPPVCSGEIPK